MPHVFYLAPTGPGVGLTSVTIGLVRALDRVGLRVHFFKPIGQPHAGDAGPERSTGILRQTMRLNPPVPIALGRAEQLMSEGNQDILMEEVVGLFQQTAADADVVIVEGLVHTPQQPYADQLNTTIAESLDAEVILVAALGHSSIHELDDRIEITARLFGGLDHPKVLGAIINKINVPRQPHLELGGGLTAANPPLTPYHDDDEDRIREQCRVFKRANFHLLGCVPWREKLLAPRTLDIANYFHAQTIHAGDMTQRRVRRFSVCARTVANMTDALQPGTLVVTPGDRDDVTLAACMAALNGVPLAGLLLTSGLEPSRAILELCEQAIATGLPILLVRPDTYQTATLLQQFNPEVPLDDVERMEWVMDSVARRLDSYWLKQYCDIDREPRMSPPAFRFQLAERARHAKKRIVLPEGEEPRTIQAAVICHERNIARCVLVGDPGRIHKVAEKQGVILPPDIEIIPPTAELREQYIPPLLDMRRHRGLTELAAREYLQDEVVLATMMLALGEVDGLVSGAIHTTANTIRPALQLIKTKPGARLVSSVFFMCLPEQVLVYGDCAINPDPNAEELADIAIQSAESAIAFGIAPRVAMISYSTGSSGTGSGVDKVREATEIARAKRPDLLIDGPLQYDAAVMADVAAAKAPDSLVAGKATVFIFPDLNTGNTTYKAVQRSANVVSIGPMLQGLRKPVNDLSRGALVDDIVYTIALTAIQAEAAS
ncbi:MAG: phosphate acetyltransferase [Chloroflexi bacterium]|nr:phosphate acetyltransferase [Chloroflexota bacterium]